MTPEQTIRRLRNAHGNAYGTDAESLAKSALDAYCDGAEWQAYLTARKAIHRTESGAWMLNAYA